MAAPCQLDAIVRQRIRHPAALAGWLGRWASPSAVAWRSRRAGRPRPLFVPGTPPTRPGAREPDPPGPASTRARHDPGLVRMPGAGSGRAGCAHTGPPEPGRAALGGCGGPAAALTRRTGRKNGARPGGGPARLGRELAGMTGLRAPRRATPYCRSHERCCGVFR